MQFNQSLRLINQSILADFPAIFTESGKNIFSRRPLSLSYIVKKVNMWRSKDRGGGQIYFL